MRYHDLRRQATNILLYICENPFSVEVSDASKNLQLELLEMQYDSILRIVSSRTFYLPFMLLYQYLDSLSYVSQYEI